MNKISEQINKLDLPILLFSTLAIVLKVASIAMADIWLIMAFFTLACFYIILSFVKTPYEINGSSPSLLNNISFKIAHNGYGLLCLGLLFYTLKWPNGLNIFAIGLLSATIAPVLFFFTRNKALALDIFNKDKIILRGLILLINAVIVLEYIK